MADQTFTVILQVPHSGGAAWRWVADQFTEELAARAIPPVYVLPLITEN